MNITIIKFLLGLHIFGVGTAYTPLTVRGCNGEPVELFVDKGLTMRWPNPYVTDAKGSFEFYTTTSKCVYIGGNK